MNLVGRCVPSTYILFAKTTNFPSPSEEEVTLTRMLDKVIRRSDTIDKESLCILAGQRVGQILV